MIFGNFLLSTTTPIKPTDNFVKALNAARKSENGFLVVAVTFLIRCMHVLSLVEWVKFFGLRVFWREEKSGRSIRCAANFWIDVFMVAKWAWLIACIWRGLDGQIALLGTSYLIAFNLFSYSFYHGWGSDHEPPSLDYSEAIWRDRRRMMSFLLAFAFSVVGFGYIYTTHIHMSLEWPSTPNRLDGLFLSLSNAFTLTYEGFQPCDQLGRGVLLAQVLNTLIFLTVLIGNAIPNVGQTGGRT